MNKKFIAFVSALALALTGTACSNKNESSSGGSSSDSKAESSESTGEDAPADDTSDSDEEEAEPTTAHVSPTETVTAQLGTQLVVDKVIQREEGSNTVMIPLADLIEDGDVINSFTFEVYSTNGADIGTYQGGCGISVTSDCAAATDEGWYQSENFSAQTEGSFGRITWNVPAEIQSYIPASGDLLFGYWWGNTDDIRLDAVTCSFTRTRELPVDGTLTQQVGESISATSSDSGIRASADFLPEDAVPEAVTFNVSAPGKLGKYVGAFGIESSAGYYQTNTVAVLTDSSSVSLTWFLNSAAKGYYENGGEFVLGYWWSEQDSVTLDSITVKYSQGSGGPSAPAPSQPAVTPAQPSGNTGFRSAAEIAADIKVGWNLGNTLECYDYQEWTTNAETAWGNPKTTQAMIDSVKSAGFNAIRIPVTWGDHMTGDTIDSAWMDRVQEVVDYAYNDGLYVILNMHHDDYTWFRPQDSEYSANSAKLTKIWTQIADRFADYGDTLLFEGMNEPRTVGSANEWMGGTAEERAVVNKYEQDFVNAVRATGGNNADRALIVTSYGASAETVAINDLIVPNDANIIVSVHYYAPWLFSEGVNTTFGDSEKSELDGKFAELKQKFIDKGTPLIIGEFGCVNAADINTRADYYGYYISAAKANGISCFIWDNNVATGDASYGLLNRSKLTWEQTIIDAVMNAVK